MLRLVAPTAWLIGLVLLAGCTRQSTTTPPEAAPQPAPTPETRGTASAPVAKTPASPPPDAPAPSEAADKSKGEPERLVLLAPGGPIVADVWLTADGRPLRESFDEVVGRVLAAADTDGDGVPTWTEWSKNDEFLKSDLANARGVDSYAVERWIEEYDENKDDRMQRDEAESWLGRSYGGVGAAGALTVRSTRYYQPMPSVTSRVWRLLDADSSGELSADEARAAPEHILAFDADDDRVITQSELATLREQLDAMAGANMETGLDPTRRAALSLHASFDTGRLPYILGDLYSPRQALTAASFPGSPRLFEKLNQDGDQWLSEQELAGLMTVDPHLELRAEFGAADAAGPPRVAFSLEHHAPEITVAAPRGADRLVVQAAGARLTLSAHDFAPPDTGVARRQVSVMVHDQVDALFAELDADGDGLLGEREVTTSPERILARDANGDRRLTADELPYAMIVALMRGEQGDRQGYYVPSYERPIPGGAEAPSWFVHGDFNRDGDISRREFLGPTHQFSSLDADRNGYIATGEATGASAD